MFRDRAQSRHNKNRAVVTCQCTALTIAHVHTQVVVLEFDAFDLEASSDCRFDSLRIIDEIEDFKSVSENLPAFPPRSSSASC